MSAPVWVASSDRDLFNGTTEYASREDAIAHGPEELDIDPGQLFRVGRKAPALEHEKLFCADDFLDRLGEMAHEACDRAGGLDLEWPGEVSKSAQLSLEVTVEHILRAWIAEHCPPDFYSIEQTSEHLAPVRS